jgi:hypothetical protein
MLFGDSIYSDDCLCNSTLEFIQRRSFKWLPRRIRMTSKENKRKYADEEEEVSTVMLKKQHAFGDDNYSSSEKEEASSE